MPSCTTKNFVKLLTLISKDYFLASVLFPFLWILLSVSHASPQDSRWWHSSLLMASQHLTQKADVADGRAVCLRSWVLRTCCGSELCSVNRAPRSMGRSPRHSHILTLGDDDTTMPDRQLIKINDIKLSIFIFISKFVHFLAFSVWSQTDWCKSTHAITY